MSGPTMGDMFKSTPARVQFVATAAASGAVMFASMEYGWPAWAAALSVWLVIFAGVGIRAVLECV